MNINRSSKPEFFLHIRTDIRVVNVSQVTTRRTIEVYRSGTPSPAGLTIIAAQFSAVTKRW